MRRLLPLFALVFAAPLVAAPVPEDKEKPKPRAKLVGTLAVEAEVSSAFWLPDGKHVALVTPDRVLVYPRDAVGTAKPKPLTTLERSGRWAGTGLTPDGGVWVFDSAGGKVNAENRLLVWGPKTVLAGGEPKPDLVITPEPDSLGGVQFSADGKSLYATVFATRAVPSELRRGEFDQEYVPRFVRMSAATGDVKKDVPFTDLSAAAYAGSGTDPSTGRLYLATTSGEETTIECREGDGGKQVWERKLTGKAERLGVGEFRLSPDGTRLAYVQPTLTVRPNPPNAGGPAGPPGFGGRGGGRPEPVSFESSKAVVLLDTKTGEPVGELTKAAHRDARVEGFSSDGRLLFARLTAAEEVRRNGWGGGRLVVWDVKAGQEVKAWDRGRADVSAAFAPLGYELAIVERERRETSFPKLARPDLLEKPEADDYLTADSVVRVRFTSTLGIWDLSAVVK